MDRPIKRVEIGWIWQQRSRHWLITKDVCLLFTLYLKNYEGRLHIQVKLSEYNNYEMGGKIPEATVVHWTPVEDFTIVPESA